MLNDVLRDVFNKEWYIKTGNTGHYIRFEKTDNQITMLNRSNKILTFADENCFHVVSMKENLVILKGIKTNLEGTHPIEWQLHKNEESYKIYKQENKLFNKIKGVVK